MTTRRGLLARLAGWVRRLPGVVALAIWATAEIIRASAMVARDIVAPSDRLAPGVLVLPLRCRTPLEISVLSGLITLTPGTLIVGVHPQAEELWVHAMYARDPEQARRELIDTETRVLRALRGRAAVMAGKESAR